MVGLSDIPFVGRVVERISDAAVDAMFRGFRYMFRSKDLVKILDNEVKTANSEEDMVSREVAKELRNGVQRSQSREDVYGELWEALVTGSSLILGIYGMPGVGKTRMMEQIWKEAKEEKIFDKVTRGNVGN